MKMKIEEDNEIGVKLRNEESRMYIIVLQS